MEHGLLAGRDKQYARSHLDGVIGGAGGGVVVDRLILLDKEISRQITAWVEGPFQHDGEDQSAAGDARGGLGDAVDDFAGPRGRC